MNDSVDLFVDSLSLFIMCDSTSYDSISNKIKDLTPAPSHRHGTWSYIVGKVFS